ncbi:MAG TPA: glycine betaine ABC transporter substrate-binding protein [Segeticoccus sp.]|uniref:glycine betaine ABC transporter substrate-binding protein n=1 Tax=Segeticoccus sp. TaxID=2706531 RepID=UPI002D805FCD|nr:glycine betaine ABC transporter substrate-binding protein [Segeticoccus sp.]HET8598684.1 glycine betaine ABC transporter substrate-binding protein [Segeticoccus sp.]
MTSASRRGRPRPRRLRRPRRGATAAALAVTLCAALAGCGLHSSSGIVLAAKPGAIKAQPNLQGVHLTVGAKNFTEQLILGDMLSTMLSAAGAKVTNLSNTPGSFGVRQGLLSGKIDLSPEYTGTGWITYLGHDNPIKGSRAQWRAVAKEDKAKNDLIWLPPAAENNTYAFAIRESKAKQLKITKLSQLKALPKKELTFCVESEFASRNDGFVPMLKKYGMKKSDLGKITVLDTGVIYTATAKGQCNFGEVFTTDGRIPRLHLRVLEDDKHFFPRYNLTEVVQGDVLRAHPELKPMMAKLNAKLDNRVMQKLNAKVDVDGDDPAIVARDWLVQEGLVRMP